MEQGGTVHKLLRQQIGKLRLYVPAQSRRGLLAEHGVCLIQDSFAALIDAQKKQRKILVCGHAHGKGICAQHIFNTEGGGDGRAGICADMI